MVRIKGVPNIYNLSFAQAGFATCWCSSGAASYILHGVSGGASSSSASSPHSRPVNIYIYVNIFII